MGQRRRDIVAQQPGHRGVVLGGRPRRQGAQRCHRRVEPGQVAGIGVHRGQLLERVGVRRGQRHRIARRRQRRPWRARRGVQA